MAAEPAPLSEPVVGQASRTSFGPVKSSTDSGNSTQADGGILDVCAGQLAALIEQASKLTQTVESMLSDLLGDNGASSPVGHGITRLVTLYSEEGAGLIEQAREVAGELIQAVGSIFASEDGSTPVEEPASPPPAPLPAAPLPVPFSPGSGSSLASLLLSSLSRSSDDVFELLFALLTPAVILLLPGSRYSWTNHEAPEPESALRFAVERPG